MKQQTEKVMTKFSRYLQEHGMKEENMNEQQLRKMLNQFNNDKDYEYDEECELSVCCLNLQ